MRTILATLASAGIVLHAAAASATPTGRVALLGPERSAIVARLERNFADGPAATAVVASCARATVTKQLSELDADTAICTDGDVVSVWKIENDYPQLIDAVPVVHYDERSIEILTARVTIAARSGRTSSESASTTIIANGGDQNDVGQPTTTVVANPAVDKPPPTPPRRIAPRLVAGLGPMLLASKAGGSFAMSVQAEIGVSRIVTFVPWVATIPVPRDVETANGDASYRPTLFGAGFGVPLRSFEKTLVPRIGAGYALLWMHTWPGAAKNGATVGQSEDLWAPAMYATAALSVGVTDHVRVAAEGLIGTATHEMIVRIARAHTDSWGAPIASLGLRAEVVLP